MIDSQTLLQWTGCLLGVAGSIALARNDRYSGWGFVAYLASNAAWLAYAYASDIPCPGVAALGLWRCLDLWRVAMARPAADQSSGRPPVGHQRRSDGGTL